MLAVSEEPNSDLPESRERRVEQKRFYFDVGSNARGVYLRISEVSILSYVAINFWGLAPVVPRVDNFMQQIK